MSEARELPQRIVVLGDGPLGVLAAIALRRALPGTELVVVALPPDPAAFAERVGTALPFTNRLHDRLGIAEEELVRRAGASHRLAMRYVGGAAPDRQGAAAYGAAVDPATTTAFAREWGGGPRNAGTAAPPLSLGEALAAEGRFAPPSGEPDSPLAELDYALRWNVPAYRDLLIDAAQPLGVRREPRKVSGIVADGAGGIAALAVEGASELAADLFIDCSGSGAMLLSKLPGARWVDWGARLPARGIAAAAPAAPVLGLEDRATLTPLGWRWEIIGRDGRQALLAVPGGAKESAVAAALGGEPAAIIPLAPGRAEAAWLGNVIALGDAAVQLEPLGGIALDAAHRQLALLLELLPGRTVDGAERAEYNRRAAMIAERACDWLAAHYAAPAAAPLFLSLERSPELIRALDQFTRRGRLPFTEEAPMLVQEWSALLQALGFPSGEAPLVAAGNRPGRDSAEDFERRMAAALRAAPSYGEWLRRVLGG